MGAPSICLCRTEYYSVWARLSFPPLNLALRSCKE